MACSLRRTPVTGCVSGRSVSCSRQGQVGAADEAGRPSPCRHGRRPMHPESQAAHQRRRGGIPGSAGPAGRAWRQPAGVSIPVAIETSRGLLVAALRATGRPVYAINPLAVSRYRDRHSVTRKKSDAGDACVLATSCAATTLAHARCHATSSWPVRSGCWPEPSGTLCGTARRSSCGWATCGFGRPCTGGGLLTAPSQPTIRPARRPNHARAAQVF
jgi:hypothetical protein